MFSSLMFLREIQPESAAHGVAAALRCRGDIDVVAFGSAASAVAARHAAVRASATPSSAAAPLALGGDSAPVTGESGDLLWQHYAAGLDDKHLTAWLDYAAHEPFDFDRGPLLRVHLYHRAAHEAIVLVLAHHSIANFWSMATLVCELETSYSGRAGGRSEPLSGLSDFVRHYCWVSASRFSAYATCLLRRST